MSDPTPGMVILFRYLHDRDVTCPVCSYNLRNLEAEHCPECGRQVVLRVRTVEPYLTAWIAAMVVACMIAGPGLLLLMNLDIWAYDGGINMLQHIVGLTSWGIGSATPILLIANRQQILMLPRRRQWHLVVVLAIYLAFCVILFAMKNP